MSEDVKKISAEDEYLSIYESIRLFWAELFVNENELYSILTDFYGEENTSCFLLDVLNGKSKKPIYEYPAIKSKLHVFVSEILNCMFNSSMLIPNTETSVSIAEYINVVLDEPEIYLRLKTAISYLCDKDTVDKLYDAMKLRYECTDDTLNKTYDKSLLPQKFSTFLLRDLDKESYRETVSVVPELRTILNFVIIILDTLRNLRILSRNKTCVIKKEFNSSSAVNIMGYLNIYGLKRFIFKTVDEDDLSTKMIFFIPDKVVTNEANLTHNIYNIYTIIKFDEYLNYYNERMFRSKYAKDEIIAGYRFSHSPSYPTSFDSFYYGNNNIFGPSELCFGDGPLKQTKMSLATMSHKENFIYYNLNDDYKNLFMLFCSQFNDYYEVESMDGGPYIFMRNIGQKISDSANNIKIENLYDYRDSSISDLCSSLFNPRAFDGCAENQVFFKTYIDQTESKGNAFITKHVIKYVASHFTYSFDGIQIILDNDVISIIKIVTDALIYALEMAYKEFKGDNSVELPFRKFLRTHKYRISNGLIYTNSDGCNTGLIDAIEDKLRLCKDNNTQWNLSWIDFKEEPIKCEIIDADIENVNYVEALSITECSSIMQLILNFINLNYKENGENQKFKEYEDGNHPVLRLS